MFKQQSINLMCKVLRIVSISISTGKPFTEKDIKLVDKLKIAYEKELKNIQKSKDKRDKAQRLQQQKAVLAIRQIKRKFGEVPSEIEATISSLPITTIKSLREALLDFHTLEDLIPWLDTHVTRG